jgi:hypothetical protein
MIQGSFEEWLYALDEAVSVVIEWRTVAQLVLSKPEFVGWVKELAGAGTRPQRGNPKYYDNSWLSCHLWDLEKAIEAVEELQAYFKEVISG